MNHTVYEEDFIPWVETQAALLRDRKFDLLDIPNLYEELTSMACHIRHQLASRLRFGGSTLSGGAAVHR